MKRSANLCYVKLYNEENCKNSLLYWRLRCSNVKPDDFTKDTRANQ